MDIMPKAPFGVGAGSGSVHVLPSASMRRRLRSRITFGDLAGTKIGLQSHRGVIGLFLAGLFVWQGSSSGERPPFADLLAMIPQVRFQLRALTVGEMCAKSSPGLSAGNPASRSSRYRAFRNPTRKVR